MINWNLNTLSKTPVALGSDGGFGLLGIGEAHGFVEQMQGIHERRNLAEHCIVPDYLALAISLLTFFCKADSLIKFPGSIRENALISPS